MTHTRTYTLQTDSVQFASLQNEHCTVTCMGCSPTLQTAPLHRNQGQLFRLCNGCVNVFGALGN